LSTSTRCSSDILDYTTKVVTETRCWPEYKQTIRSFNLADLHGPIPSSAYFGAQSISPNFGPDLQRTPTRESPCSTAICEDQYFPTIALPSILTKLEPAFISCFPFLQNEKDWPVNMTQIHGGWDPAIVLDRTTVVLPSINPVTAHYKPLEATPAVLPGPRVSDGRPPTTEGWSMGGMLQPTPSYEGQPENSTPARQHRPLPSGQSSALPATTIVLGNEVVAITAVSGGNAILLESQTILAGGSALTTAGKTFSLDPQGRLFMDKTQLLFQIPTPTSPPVFRIDGKDVIATFTKNGKDGASDIVVGSVTLRPGGSAAVYGSRTLSLDSQGNLFDGLDPVTTLSGSMSAPAKPKARNKSGGPTNFGEAPLCLVMASLLISSFVLCLH
jgi:hypothetical protein